MFVVSVLVHRNGEQLHHNKQSATISQSLFSFLTPPNMLLLACLRSFISIAKTNCIFCSHFIVWWCASYEAHGNNLTWFALVNSLKRFIWLDSCSTVFISFFLLLVAITYSWIRMHYIIKRWKMLSLEMPSQSHFCWSIVCSQHRECQYFVFFSRNSGACLHCIFVLRRMNVLRFLSFTPSSVCSSFALRHCSFWMHLIAAKDV